MKGSEKPSGGRGRMALPVAVACVLLALWGWACGNDACNKDTDCKLPQICIAGVCALLNPMDGTTDFLVDIDALPEQTDPDIVETIDIQPDETVDPADVDAAEEEIEEVVEEDIEEEELPPATVIWSDDFSDAPVRWEYQNGDWSVEGGEYVQGSINSFAESWVPAESWTDLAVEVSLMSVSRDTSAVKNVLGIIVRVQQISRNKYYLCGIDYKTNELTIVEYDQDVLPGYATLCAASDLVPTLADDTWYKLQAVVAGDLITCRWLEGDTARVQISVRDDSYPSGSIGLFAYNASGRFDNVIVFDHRPPEWPTATRRETCP